MGLEPAAPVSWEIGTRVRVTYQERFGQLPQKALREKTGGGGSHCFAVYPISMRGEIERIVREYSVEAAKQGDLFA
jgi:hypothetical protein